MRVYQSTASKNYYCAFRCAECGKISVTTGKFSVERSGGPSSSLAHAASISALTKKLPAFYDRINREHDLGGMNASSNCSFCHKTQEWDTAKSTVLPQLLMTILFAALLTGIVWLLAPKTYLFGLLVFSVVISACCWKAYGMLARRIGGKLLQRRLQARNFNEDLWPMIGDPEYIRNLPPDQLEDPRVKAILNSNPS